MPGQDGEAEEQPTQVREDDPLVGEVGDQSLQAGTCLESGHADLVENDGGETRECDVECSMMENGDASQRGAEEHELDRNHAGIIWRAPAPGRRRDGPV
jgi:hypothetical protein